MTLGRLQRLVFIDGVWVPILGGGDPVPGPHGFTMNQDEPTQTNVGLAGIGVNEDDLEVINGDAIITTPGYHFTGYKVKGRILPRAADIEIDTFAAVGYSTVPSSDSWLLDTNHAGNTGGLYVHDGDLHPQTIGYRWNGLGPRDVTAERLKIWDTSDGFSWYKIPSTGVNALEFSNCWVGPLIGWRVATSIQSDGISHNDGMQLQFTNGGRMHHCAIHARLRQDVGNPDAFPYIPQATSAIMLNNNGGYTSQNWELDHNWLYDGVLAINGGGLNGLTASGSIHDNLFGGVQALPNGYIWLDSAGADGHVWPNTSGSGSPNIDTYGNLKMGSFDPVTIRRNT